MWRFSFPQYLAVVNSLAGPAYYGIVGRSSQVVVVVVVSCFKLSFSLDGYCQRGLIP